MNKILVVDSISKDYPGRSAVKGVSFSVTAGAIHGFLGPNGAGKSTTMKMIAGLIPATSGRIELFGKDIGKQDISKLIGMLPENPPLYLDMSVRDYIEYVANLHGIGSPKEKSAQILKELSLDNVSKRIIGNLSKGYKQRVGLAAALVYDAPFIILDEPTNGLDPQSVVELREFIKKLSQKKTILFSSHILSEVEQLCDEITIIHDGAIKATGKVSDIRHMFKKGLTIKVGVSKGSKLPPFEKFGEVVIESNKDNEFEDFYYITFTDPSDPRAKLSKYLIENNVDLTTLVLESPELEDIFLEMTEKK